MRMRHVFIITLSIMLLCSVALGGTAFAADTFISDGVTLSSIRTSPVMLPGDGEVSVTVNIAVDTSRAEGGLTNVRIIGEAVKTTDAIETVNIGDNSDLGFTLLLKSAQLGKPVPLTVMWDGASAGLAFQVTIPSTTPADPVISFTRTIDKTSVEMGESVAITYTVKNSGAIDITDLVLTDAGVGEEFRLTEPSLPAGTTKTMTLNYTVNADMISSPRLSYKAGSTSYTAQCPDKAVKLKVVELEAVLRAILPEVLKPGGEVTLVCDLVNSGSVKLSSIVIDEPTLGKRIFNAPSLDKESSMQFAKTVTLMHTTKFQYTITAKDDSGNTVTVKSNELEVAVDSGSGQYDIEIMASPDAIQLAEPEKVNFEISVTNKGANPVEGVTITDQEGGVLIEDEPLPVGVSKFTYVKLIDRTTVFNFTLSVHDKEGDYVRSTGQVEIKVAEPTPSPEATAAASATPEPTTTESVDTGAKPIGSLGDIFKAMIVVGGLIVITIIVLVIMIISDKVKKRKQR